MAEKISTTLEITSISRTKEDRRDIFRIQTNGRIPKGTTEKSFTISLTNWPNKY